MQDLYTVLDHVTLRQLGVLFPSQEHAFVCLPMHMDLVVDSGQGG